MLQLLLFIVSMFSFYIKAFDKMDQLYQQNYLAEYNEERKLDHEKLLDIAHDCRLFIDKESRLHDIFKEVTTSNQIPLLDVLKDTESLYRYGKRKKHSIAGMYTRDAVKEYYKPVLVSYQNYIINSDILAVEFKLFNLLKFHYVSYKNMQNLAYQILDNFQEAHPDHILCSDIINSTADELKRLSQKAYNAYKRKNKTQFKIASAQYPQMHMFLSIQSLIKGYQPQHSLIETYPHCVFYTDNYKSTKRPVVLMAKKIFHSTSEREPLKHPHLMNILLAIPLKDAIDLYQYVAEGDKLMFQEYTKTLQELRQNPQLANHTFPAFEEMKEIMLSQLSHQMLQDYHFARGLQQFHHSYLEEHHFHAKNDPTQDSYFLVKNSLDNNNFN